MALSGAIAADKLATKNHEKISMFKWPSVAQLQQTSQQQKITKKLQCLNGPQRHNCMLAYMLATTNPEKPKPQQKQQPQTRNPNQSYHQGYAVKPRRMMILIINKINTNADTNYLNADTDYLNLILSIHSIQLNVEDYTSL